jgi:hypothetical protein
MVAEAASGPVTAFEEPLPSSPVHLAYSYAVIRPRLVPLDILVGVFLRDPTGLYLGVQFGLNPLVRHLLPSLLERILDLYLIDTQFTRNASGESIDRRSILVVIGQHRPNRNTNRQQSDQERRDHPTFPHFGTSFFLGPLGHVI